MIDASASSMGEFLIIHSCRQVFLKTVLAPVERVQLLMQCDRELQTSGRLGTSYRGITDCALRTFRTEGTLSLFRGNVTNCMPILFSLPCTLLVNNYLKGKMLPAGDSPRYVKMAASFCLTGITFVANYSLIYHFDFVRTRLATDILEMDGKAGFRHFNGTLDVYRKILKSDGVLGLYRGFLPCCLGNILHTGAALGVYEVGKSHQPEHFGYLPWIVCLSFFSNLITTPLVYPFDTVRRRMMMRSGEPDTYKTARECFKTIKQEGVMMLWRGMTANLLRTVAGVVVFSTFEKLITII